MEPNDLQGWAAPLPEDDRGGFEICADDHDWFELSPSEPDTLYVVGVQSTLAGGDLDSDLIAPDGSTYGWSWIWDGMYHSEGSVGPTDVEKYAIVGGPDVEDVALHVFGYEGATNTYGLVSRALPWRDGPDCEAFFPVTECRAQTSGGATSPSLLIPFPVGTANDPYLGHGVFMNNGLGVFTGQDYMSSATQYGRRELLMIVRHAIHSVEQAFPGTAPLGIGDVGMPDGSTPEGHPNGTHYEGANIDFAYYVKPEAHGAHGNLVYRQICCDAALEDWSCVDTNTSSADYGVCVDGSETTHIVDVPRTAMAIAKIAGSGRLRVIGVEAKVKPELLAALEDLEADGLITSTEHAYAAALMASKDDHSSWLWHFNHMHASFCVGACGGKPDRLAEGPWPDLPLDEQSRRAEAWYRSR
jgi:hypothetical protein